MYNDIDHRNPYVREELNYWAKWYYDTIEYEGVRLDAVKHESPVFTKNGFILLRKIQVKYLCCRRILGSRRNRITRKICRRYRRSNESF